jgi:hypothetical protein
MTEKADDLVTGPKLQVYVKYESEELIQTTHESWEF